MISAKKFDYVSELVDYLHCQNRHACAVLLAIGKDIHMSSIADIHWRLLNLDLSHSTQDYWRARHKYIFLTLKFWNLSLMGDRLAGVRSGDLNFVPLFSMPQDLRR